MRWLGAMLLALAAPAMAERPPIIDMHLHADAVDNQGPPPMGMCTPVEMPAWDQRTPYAPQFLKIFKQPRCKDPIWSPTSEAELLRRNLAMMEKLNVVGVLSADPERVAAWKKAAPQRFLSGLNLRLERGYPLATVQRLREAGALDVLAEVTTEYEGIAPDDPRLEPYWAYAEAQDLPIGLHIGPGPPGMLYMGASDMTARLFSALTLEPVLLKHPRLRIYVMHAGYPKIDDMLALMYVHPQVYVDTGAIVYTQPRADFWAYLKRITDAGFGNRVMFGSDQMVWPEAIERAVKVIEDAPFLDAAQKRAILFDNAARFLRLTPAQIAAHEAMGR